MKDLVAEAKECKHVFSRIEKDKKYATCLKCCRLVRLKFDIPKGAFK